MKIEMNDVFDTYKSSSGFDFLSKEIPKGLIVIAAGQDDISTNLSGDMRYWFNRLGSKEIFKVEYREPYVFIG